MSDPQRGDFEVNARTLIITAGALVALAAPTVANARMLPGGALTGVWITLTPSLRNTSSKAALNLLLRSWIRNRVRSRTLVKLRLRACWVTQMPCGVPKFGPPRFAGRS